MIKFKDGDLLDSNAEVIAHCVNCHSVMDSGLAEKIKKKWHDVFRNYRAQCALTYNKELLLGICQPVKIGDRKYVVNLFGQDRYRQDKRELNYEYFYIALENLKKFMEKEDLHCVSFPDMIGCGLAGGERQVVIAMIETVLKNFSIEFWKLI